MKNFSFSSKPSSMKGTNSNLFDDKFVKTSAKAVCVL